MLDQIYRFGNTTLTGREVVAVGVSLALFLLLLIVTAAWRRAARRARTAEDRSNDETEAHMAALMRAQGEITGHVQGLSQRLDGFGHRLGQSMTDTTRTTQASLAQLGERLAVIDKAQQTITALSSQVVELQHILADKQTRGAFGQARMEAIVRDALPANAYRFQATLTNGTRPDCLILFPDEAPSLVIDAKFPLEAWNAIRAAATPEATKAAEAQFRRDTLKHVQDIAERYLVPGETHDTAFLFVPSESIFADIHERFEDIIQRAHRQRVVVVSPSLLMLSIQVVLSLLRDQRMREQAHVIQDEVIRLIEDVARLDDRVRKLGLHFNQANKDVDEILISSRKITSRGQRIEAVEFEEDEAAKSGPAPTATPTTPEPAAREPDRRQLPFTGFDEV